MLKNKTILLLGGSSSIGSEFINNYYKKFHTVISTYYDSDNKIKNYKNVINYKINLSKSSEINKFKKFLNSNKLFPDIIVNLAAPKLKFSRFENNDYNDYVSNFEIQLKPFFEIVKFSIKKMQKNNFGKVICLLSSSIIDLPSYMNPYISCKYALLGFMSGLASEYKKYDIDFSNISPSMIQTKFISNIPNEFVSLSNQKKKLLKTDQVSKYLYKIIRSKNKNKLNNFI
jgi:short-subunit dehydrogenase